MNIAMEQTEEHVNGVITNRYGDAFIRGNNGRHLWSFGLFHSFLTTLFTRKSCTFRRQSRFDDTLCFIDCVPMSSNSINLRLLIPLNKDMNSVGTQLDDEVNKSASI